MEATTQGMQAIAARGDLIRKINFPKYIIVISGTISAFINLILNLAVVFIFMLFDKVDFHWTALLFPVTILIIYAFSLGLAFFLAATYVKFRDISHLWEIFLQGLFYATPIIYPLQQVASIGGNIAAQMLMLSPVAVLFQQARADILGYEDTLTANQLFSNPIYLAIPYFIIILVIIVGGLYFKRGQAKFAEQL